MPVRDLSRRIEAGMPVFPGDPDVSVEPHATMAADGYRVSALSLGTHAGTHVDAPSHTEPEGATLDAFGVERFRWRAARVDLREKGPRAAIRREDLPDTAVDALLLDTGWAGRWGTDAALDHPFLDPDAAAWCAERGLDVATDAMSVDPSRGDGVPAHRELLGAGRLIAENLRNLDGLPRRFDVRVYPLPIAGGDGAPARAVAVTG